MKIQVQNLLNREYPMVKHEDHEAAMKAKMDQALQIIKKLREKNQKTQNRLTYAIAMMADGKRYCSTG